MMIMLNCNQNVYLDVNIKGPFYDLKLAIDQCGMGVNISFIRGTFLPKPIFFNQTPNR